MEFRKYKLIDLATFSQGKQVELKDQYIEKTNNRKRFIRIVDYTNINEPIRYVDSYGHRYYAEKDDLVMIRYGSQTAGMVVMGKEGIIANNMFKINLNNEIALNKYMYYYLSQKTIFNYLRNSQSSSTMPAINFGMLNDFEINLPEITEQSKVIQILLLIDKRIELNNQINDNLQEISKQLYKRWFVDFEFPNKEGNPYKSSGGKMVDSELGEIPEGWTVKTLNQISNNFDSKRKPLSSRERELKKGDVPYYGATSIIDYVDDYLFDGIYVLMGEDGTVINADNTPVLQYVWKKCWVNNHTHILQGNGISTEHLMECLKATDVSSIITGAVQLKINQSNMNTLKYTIAPKNINDKFEKIIELIYEKIRGISDENINLIKLRDTLLPKLMNGEIDLENIEI